MRNKEENTVIFIDNINIYEDCESSILIGFCKESPNEVYDRLKDKYYISYFNQNKLNCIFRSYTCYTLAIVKFDPNRYKGVTVTGTLNDLMKDIKQCKKSRRKSKENNEQNNLINNTINTEELPLSELQTKICELVCGKSVKDPYPGFISKCETCENNFVKKAGINNGK